MTKLRLAVIGAGSWVVASHLPNLARRAGDVTFVGVCRTGREPLERIRNDWGFAVASEDYRDVLDAGADIAVIASPAALHFEHAKAALQAGAHVLVEKPFTLASRDAWELVRLASEKRLHLLVSFGYNYRPLLVGAQSLMQSQEGIGAIENVQVSMCSVTRELLTDRGAYPLAAPLAQPEPATWTDPALSGGGYGQAQLTHAVAAALWLTGLRAAEAFAFMAAPAAAAVELHDSISVRFHEGAIGTVSGASAHLGYQGNRDHLQIRLVGSRGHLDLLFERDYVGFFRPGKPPMDLQLPAGAGAYDCKGPPNALVDLALGKCTENASPGELGARTVELLEAAYRSRDIGRPIPVPDHQGKPLMGSV
jgi:predicted dehydrogenase